MKTIGRFLVIVCFLAFLLPQTAALAMFADTFGPKIFAPDDMSVNELKLYTTKDEALTMFGAPQTTESFTWEATGESFEVWHFEDLTLTFNAQGEVINALVYGKQYTGPRGVHVGQSVNDVIKLFYLDPAATTTVLYTSGYVEALDAQLPPCGYVLRNEDKTFSINYVAPVVPFDDAVLADLTNYIYQDLALFTIDFGVDATVADFSWKIGPWAE